MHPRLHSATILLLAGAFSLPASAGLFGPTINILEGEALRQKLQSQPVHLSVSGSTLDIRSKAAAVGGFLLGFVASSALASGGMQPGQSAQQMQQNMQMASSFNQNLQTTVTQMAADQAVRPTSQVAKEGPAVLVRQQLAAGLLQDTSIQLGGQGGAKPGAADLYLRVTQPVWKLDFSMASSDYTLLYQADVSLYQAAGDTIFFKTVCKSEAPTKMPLPAWEADDFSAVAAVADDLGRMCAQQVLAALGIRPSEAKAPATASAQAPVVPEKSADPGTAAEAPPAPASAGAEEEAALNAQK